MFPRQFGRAWLPRARTAGWATRRVGVFARATWTSFLLPVIPCRHLWRANVTGDSYLHSTHCGINVTLRGLSVISEDLHWHSRHIGEGATWRLVTSSDRSRTAPWSLCWDTIVRLTATTYAEMLLAIVITAYASNRMLSRTNPNCRGGLLIYHRHARPIGRTWSHPPNDGRALKPALPIRKPGPRALQANGNTRARSIFLR